MPTTETAGDARARGVSQAMAALSGNEEEEEGKDAGVGAPLSAHLLSALHESSELRVLSRRQVCVWHVYMCIRSCVWHMFIRSRAPSHVHPLMCILSCASAHGHVLSLTVLRGPLGDGGGPRG